MLFRSPFGLRRAAIGVLRILVERKLNLGLGALIKRAVELQPVQASEGGQEIFDYFVERLRTYLLDPDSAAHVKGATTESFDAVLASVGVPLDLRARLEALLKFLAMPEAASLTAANKRISNILRKSDPGSSSGAVAVNALREPAEVALHESLAGVVADIDRALAKRDYAAALARLATLRPAVDGFFDAVMVNVEDPAVRRNRLALLTELRRQFLRIADLSCLPG